ncbi:DUF2793 domain-containing protein [Erythrobacter sp. W53]|uniref:DUF2793 domain-containing protein n=1 Tax=Erythrobacter sp. W53 TaxID=3425947 RepID=UPI003D768670
MPNPVTFPSASARFSMPFLFAGQSQKEFFVNESVARIDALLHPTIVEERGDPPASPSEGDAYLIATTATGNWEGKEGQIAVWQGSYWLLIEPRDGMMLRDASSGAGAGQLLLFQGSWIRPSAIAAPTGGTSEDTEARAAIESILSALQVYGILPSP